jgi:hypothetical protein
MLPALHFTFWIGSWHLLPRPTWTVILLLMFPKLLDDRDRHLPLCPHFFIGWDEVLQTICLGWPQTSTLLISTSQEARMHWWNSSEHSCLPGSQDYRHEPPVLGFKAFLANVAFHLSGWLNTVWLGYRDIPLKSFKVA